MKLKTILLSSAVVLLCNTNIAAPDNSASDSLDTAIEEIIADMRLVKHEEYDLVMFGRANIRAEQYNNAIADFILALEQDSTNAETHYYLAKAYYGKSEQLKYDKLFDKALIHIDIALRLNPEYGSAAYQAGIWLDGRGMIEDAVNYFEVAARNFDEIKVPDSAKSSVYIILGDYYFGNARLLLGDASQEDKLKNSLAKAQQYYESAQGISSLDPRTKANLSWVQLQTAGNKLEALEQIVKEQPQNAQYHFMYAQ